MDCLCALILKFTDVQLRRALMRLQTENRRTSQISTMTLDLPRGGPATSNAAKRASFIPLTNTPAGRTNAHRRISSVSEPGSTHLEQSQWASSPPATSTEFSQPPPSAFSGSSNRRQSGFWARPLSLQPDHPPMVDPAEFDETRKEVQTLREQLEAMKGDLAEAQEAQEASETCVKALRTFIAENSIGVQTTTTGPALTSPVTRTEEISKPSLASKWGFKLWKVDTTSNPTPSNISPAPQSPPASTPVNSAPLTKFGGLFSARTSISSVSNHRPDLPPRSQDMACNTSDSSSLEDVVAEPISPVSETPRSHVAIHVAGEPSTEMLLFPSQIKELHSFHEPTAVSPS